MLKATLTWAKQNLGWSAIFTQFWGLMLYLETLRGVSANISISHFLLVYNHMMSGVIGSN